MMKNFIFILLVGYAAGRVMSDDNFSGPDFALSGEYRGGNTEGIMRFCEVTQKVYAGGIFHVTVYFTRVVSRLTLLFI